MLDVDGPRMRKKHPRGYREQRQRVLRKSPLHCRDNDRRVATAPNRDRRRRAGSKTERNSRSKNQSMEKLNASQGWAVGGHESERRPEAAWFRLQSNVVPADESPSQIRIQLHYQSKFATHLLAGGSPRSAQIPPTQFQHPKRLRSATFMSSVPYPGRRSNRSD